MPNRGGEENLPVFYHVFLTNMKNKLYPDFVGFNDLSNHRPIFLLPQFSKNVENIFTLPHVIF